MMAREGLQVFQCGHCGARIFDPREFDRHRERSRKGLIRNRRRLDEIDEAETLLREERRELMAKCCQEEAKQP